MHLHTFVYLATGSTAGEDEEDTDDHVFIAFARIFSGILRRGSRVFFLGPKHDPGEILNEASYKPHQDLNS